MSLTRRIALAALGGLFLTACASTPDTPPDTTIYLVRHAEKEAGDNPPLTLIGRQRADILAQDLKDAGLTAIWSTDYRRTLETAKPTAHMANLPVQLYDPRDLPGFAATLKATPGVMLVVGHSNTTPELVDLLGGDAGPAIDEATEYDRLYVVEIRGKRVTSELRRFGR
ncbi:MAG: phosphoglycerate mutase family protein [Hyphomonas sp.]|uniref:SixA phosphatase family protein n=1 Tax=Hyphomonas sp. TaxID=87 RepID=UPI0035279E4C